MYQNRFHTLIKLHDKIKHLISCVKNKKLLKSFSFKNKINYIYIHIAKNILLLVEVNKIKGNVFDVTLVSRSPQWAHYFSVAVKKKDMDKFKMPSNLIFQS